MPLLVTSVPNLVQGISQQPDNLRYPGQSDEQVNAWSTIVEGLVKRPNTDFVKDILPTDDADLFTHFVKRDENNKYVVTVAEYDVSGTSTVEVKATNVETGADIPISPTTTATNYLSGITNPKQELKALTVADYTFLVNKSKKVKIDTDPDSKSRGIRNDDGKYEALIFVKLGDYEKTYNIYLDGQEVPFGGSGLSTNKTPPAGHTYESGSPSSGTHADTEVIAEDLEIILNAYLPANQSVTGSVLSGGSGFTDSGNYFGALRGSRTISYEFFIEQYDVDYTLPAAVQIGFGAMGTAVIKNGTIQSSVLTKTGSGYDSTLPSNTLKLVMRELTTISKGTKYNTQTGVLKIDIDYTDVGYTMPTITSTTFISNSYEVERQGAVIKITSDKDLSVRTEDGLANQGLGVAYKEVNSIVDLPERCFNDFRIKVRGDADTDQDDYYVQFETKDKEDYGEGSWVEIAGWTNDPRSAKLIEGIDTAFNNNTMPITLVPELDTNGNVSKLFAQSPQELSSFVKVGSTIYNVVEDHESVEADNKPGSGTNWEDYWVESTLHSDAPAWIDGIKYSTDIFGYENRDAGDDNTNPFPSFTGNTINDVFFFKNRLGFLTDSNVVFSEADNYFNFFRTTTQQLLDSAPIDVGLSHTKVAVLQHALPFQEKLMLFSRQSQFVLRGADILSPKTVSISPVTEYDISDNIDPVALGNFIYFPFKRDAYEGVYEYFVDNNTEVFEATEITAQVPKLIPSDVSHMIGTASENMIVCKSSADARTLYVYKYYWQNKEKIQSAWMKFTYNYDIRGFDFIDSELYLIMSDGGDLRLEKAIMENGVTDTGLDYRLLLDSRVDGSSVTVGDYVENGGNHYYCTESHTSGVSFDSQYWVEVPALTPAPAAWATSTAYSSGYDPASKTTTLRDLPYDPDINGDTVTDLQFYTKGGTNKEFTKTSATSGTLSGTLASYVDDGSGDYVLYNGDLYYCIKAHTSTSEFQKNYWREVTEGPASPNTWTATTAYNAGVIYKCQTTHTAPNSFVAVDTSVTPNITYWTASSEVSSANLWKAGSFYNNDKYFFVGLSYNMLYRFSNQILKQPTERGGRSASDYTFQTIRNASIEYADTGHFTVEVTPRFRDTYSYPYNPALLASLSTLDSFTPESGHFRFAVQAQPNEATIEVKSDSALPCKLLAAEFESMIIPRAKRYGS